MQSRWSHFYMRLRCPDRALTISRMRLTVAGGLYLFTRSTSRIRGQSSYLCQHVTLRLCYDMPWTIWWTLESILELCDGWHSVVLQLLHVHEALWNTYIWFLVTDQNTDAVISITIRNLMCVCAFLLLLNGLSIKRLMQHNAYSNRDNALT